MFLQDNFVDELVKHLFFALSNFLNQLFLNPEDILDKSLAFFDGVIHHCRELFKGN